jgi:membrane protein required for colicin V production
MIFDIVVLSALLISGIIAFLRGFIREVLTIFGILGGLVAAYFLGKPLTPIVQGWLGVVEGQEPKKLLEVVPYDILGQVLAYGGVFLVVVIVLTIVSHVLSGAAKAAGLGPVDRTLGVIFGLARGLLLLALLYMPVQLFVDDEQRNEWFKDSKTRIYIEGTSSWLSALVPETMKEDAKDKGEKAAEDAAQATRERLEKIDILKPETETQKEPPAPVAPTEQNGTGYERQERQDLNQLLETQEGQDQ